LAWHADEQWTGATAGIRQPGCFCTDQNAPSLKWYAIRVASNFEKATAQALRGRGIEEFLPLYSRLRHTPNGSSRQVELALFPGYVFGRFDVYNRLPILTIPGVMHIVGFGRTPVPVDADELAALKRILDSRLLVEPWPFMKVGERISIERGPLRGLKGTVLVFKGTYRLIASITLLQRSVAAEIDRESVRPLPSRICPIRVEIPLPAAVR
jgi:transcription antitermination factor NusG